MAAPNLTYSYFSYKVMGSDATPTTKTLDHLPTSSDDPVKVSFQDNYNSITIKYTPDKPLCYFQVRIHEDGQPGIATGTRWYYSGPNIAGSTEQTVNLTVDSSYFPGGTTASEKVYVIGLYGKASDEQGAWDATYLYLSSEGYIVATKDFDGIEVLSGEPIPSN